MAYFRERSSILTSGQVDRRIGGFVAPLLRRPAEAMGNFTLAKLLAVAGGGASALGALASTSGVSSRIILACTSAVVALLALSCIGRLESLLGEMNGGDALPPDALAEVAETGRRRLILLALSLLVARSPLMSAGCLLLAAAFYAATYLVPRSPARERRRASTPALALVPVPSSSRAAPVRSVR